MKRKTIFKVLFVFLFFVVFVNSASPDEECYELFWWPADMECQIQCAKHDGCRFWDAYEIWCENGFCMAEWDVYCYDGHRFSVESGSWDPACFE